MSIKRHIGPLLTCAMLLIAPLGASGAGFCVEDADDALWVDCRESVTGVTQTKTGEKTGT